MMKTLYVTRWNVPIETEHVFIKTVWNELKKCDEAELLTILVRDVPSSSLSFAKELKAWLLIMPASFCSDRVRIISEIRSAFERIAPDLIHSNMQEGYELEAATLLKIPAVTTIHIGSVICPRGGNGLWTKDDRICDGKIGKKCIDCCCNELPCSFFAKAILRLTPSKIKRRLNHYFNRHHTFFFTRLFNIENGLDDRQRYLKNLANHYPVAANVQLYELLKYYDCSPRLIPHGVNERHRLSLPPVEGKIKFYYVGRICHQKGLHIAIEAFKGINRSLYEFHVIGEPNSGRKNQQYFKKILRDIKDINGFFHGYVENSQFDGLVKDWHVMIHPAICHEVYGLTIAEALSVGRPVLATRCYGSEMQVEDNVNGWLVPTNDVKAMREKIVGILNKKSELHDISSRCKTPHKMEDYVRSLMENYKQIINENHR